MKEASIRRLFRDKCREWGYMQIPLTGTAIAGVPDVYVVDLNLFIEFKRPDGKGRLSKLQEKTRKDIEKHMGNVMVIADRKTLEMLCPSSQLRLYLLSQVKYPQADLKTSHLSSLSRRSGQVI